MAVYYVGADVHLNNTELAVEYNKEIIRRFLEKSTVTIVDATHETAEVYAQVKDGLRKSGRPIPTNDVWIAAQVLEAGAVLVTYDSHFRAIPGLRI